MHAVMSTISDGVANGQIRPDAGLDLQQLVRNARETSDLAGVQQKIAVRESEGAISSGAAEALRAAVAALAATMT